MLKRWWSACVQNFESQEKCMKCTEEVHVKKCEREVKKCGNEKCVV